jgi:hypothetical protein
MGVRYLIHLLFTKNPTPKYVLRVLYLSEYKAGLKSELSNYFMCNTLWQMQSSSFLNIITPFSVHTVEWFSVWAHPAKKIFSCDGSHIRTVSLNSLSLTNLHSCMVSFSGPNMWWSEAAKLRLYGRCGRKSNFRYLIASVVAAVECRSLMRHSKENSPWTTKLCACSASPASASISIFQCMMQQ